MTRAAGQRGVTKKATEQAAAVWHYDASQGIDALRGQEWVLANGLGGFAMGSAAGIPTRRYHALLIGATRPPVGRVAALNGMIESVEGGGRVTEFSTFEFNGRPDPLAHPDGASRLKRFEFDDSARWTYSSAEIELERELVMFAGMNAAGLRYTLKRSGAAAKLEARFKVRPLISLRDFHGLIRRGWADNFGVEVAGSGVALTRDGHELRVEVTSESASAFIHDEQWWYDFFYREDAARGQDCIEDLFSPGYFELAIGAGESVVTVELIAWMGGDKPAQDFAAELVARRARGGALAAAAMPAGAGEREKRLIGMLARSTDLFVVARQNDRGSRNGVSTIAGYPWFSDWGRDTFISLPGLLLATGRFDEARRELASFARARRNGLIPNVFNDQTGEPEFNTVDASLWFVHAACRWLEATGDRAGFESQFLDACFDVVQSYRRGTEFNIAMDPIDKLITAGTNATQLTWMDARRDGVTFTPRHGKAVEINALWYNALKSLAAAVPAGKGTLAADLNDLAGAVGRSFAGKFWDAKRKCLYDCLTPSDGVGWVPDESVRPNQVFAASLPHSALSVEQRCAVVECVRSRLLTPMGVRTLDPADSRYRGRYHGSLFERDGAYHQGTAWPWLLAPLAEAVLRAGDFSAAAKKDAMAIIQPILHTVETGEAEAQIGTCAGQFAEVYDGNSDDHGAQRAGGCPAQAWSIAETLRVLKLIVG